MDAIVLAGGYATRLWPITRHRPKMLLPIGDSTVIGTVFDALEAEPRIDDVFVSTNRRFEQEFKAYLSEKSYTKPRLTVENAGSESEKPGVVSAIGQLVEREGLSDDTLILAGDNLMNFALGEFLDAFEATGDPTIAAHDIGSYERASSYGLIELDGSDAVVGFQEKPDTPKSTLVSVACYAIPGETLPLFGAYLSGENNPDEPGWFIQWLQERDTVRAFTFEEAWFDIGTPGSYLDAVSWRLGGDNYVSPSASVERSELAGNVHVMEGATVTDATLESSVVFPGATIRGSELRRSIIDQDTDVESLTLSSAVVGPHTQLNGR